MRYAIVFVCQQGPLEIQAMLLAASLRTNLGRDCELIAAVPAPESVWGRPAGATFAFLGSLGVRTAAIVNRISTNYAIGNKLSCLSVGIDADVRVFLDTDMLCMGSLALDPVARDSFFAKPADLCTFSASDVLWRHIYAQEGLSMPCERVQATVSGEDMPPYFNSGFIAVHAEVGFGEAWIESCLTIDADSMIRDKRPWLDQIALPVAARKLGLRWTALAEEYNFPCHLRATPDDGSVRFAHYHWPSTIRGAPALRRCVDAQLERYPDLERAFAGDKEFRCLLRPEDS